MLFLFGNGPNPSRNDKRNLSVIFVLSTYCLEMAYIHALFV
jgi:hypothetical protein